MRILLSFLALGVTVCVCNVCLLGEGMKLPKTSQGLVGIMVGLS